MRVRRYVFRSILTLLPTLAALNGLSGCSRKERVLNVEPGGAVTWTNTIRHLLADRSEGSAPTGCTSCHHANTTIPDWTDYETVKAYKDLIDSRLSLPRTDPNNTNMARFLEPDKVAIVRSWCQQADPPK